MIRREARPGGARLRVAACAILVVISSVWGPCRTVAAADAGKDAPGLGRTIERSVDPVIIVGGVLGAAQGLALEGFRLFSSDKGVMAPIPFQIDEVDAEGLFVLPAGRKPNQDGGHRGKEKDLPGVLDTNDELVFMASDLGDRVPRDGWPQGVSKGLEIEVRDPGTGGKGWAYLLWLEAPPPPSDRDYVRYAVDEDRIYSEGYSLGYSPERDLVYTTSLSMFPKGAGAPVDIMDRINIRFSATILLKSITFSRNEDDFVSSVIAYKDGPVRAMRRVANSMRLVMGLKTPKIIAYSVYYRDAIETPNVLRLPVSLGAVARSAYFEGGTDHNRNALGMRFYSPKNMQGALVDGRMSPEELSMDYGALGWTMLSGTQGHTLSVVELGEKMGKVVEKRLIYVDDMFASNGPEDEPGSTPKLGFFLENLLALKKGTYRYNARFYFLPEYAPGMEKAYLDVIENPLEVRVSP